VKEELVIPLKVALPEHGSALFLHERAIFLNKIFKGNWIFTVKFRRGAKVLKKIS